MWPPGCHCGLWRRRNHATFVVDSGATGSAVASHVTLLINTGATIYVHVLAMSVALDCDPLVTMFVVDTGANGTILGRPLHDAGLCSAYQATPGRYVHSNDHRDEVLGTAALACRFPCADMTTVDLTINGLSNSPSSRWSILPPSNVPGFTGASIALSGVISIRLASGKVLTTVPYQGLQVLFFSVVGDPRPPALANPVSRQGPRASPSLLVRQSIPHR